jgi:hypothetical protein
MAQYGSVDQARIHLQRADARWEAALEGFDSYIERLQRLSEAAEEERKALLFAEVCDAPWSPIDVGPNYSPAENLEPGHRPGPDAIWKDFDNAVQQLGRALGGNGFAAVASAFADLSQAANGVASKLVELGIEQPMPERQTG